MKSPVRSETSAMRFAISSLVMVVMVLLADDGCFVDGGWILWCAGVTVFEGCGGDGVDGFDAFEDFTEGGVLVVEVLAVFAAEADEELRAGGVGVGGAGHGEDTFFVFGVVEFGIDVVAGATCAGAVGAATLDDEIGEDAVEVEIIVEAFFGEFDEVFGVAWGDIGPDFDEDVAFAGFKFDLWVGHVQLVGLLLMMKDARRRGKVRGTG